ncbi:MAG: Gfo/Idh/MocA family oxidoreductase [Oscillospiraceae bacterium]|nr:Gfo/Idh/MocA family oxidoreductase [Oscillospiraceae bacterium]
MSSSNSKIRMGIAGIGNMGSHHAKVIFGGEIEGMELGAVCDIAENKEEWAKSNLEGVPFYYDYKEMIQSGNIDAVLIATPHYLHPPIAVCGFEHGLHVLIEKPAGVFTKQVEEMNQAAIKAGKVFCIMYNQRTNPVFAKAREMVQSGQLGELKRCVWIITNWYRTQSYYDSGSWRATWEGEGGGVLINQCPHNLDLWQWIFGMPVKISGNCAYGKYHDIEVEDDVTAYAEYADGSTGVFITTTGECPGTNRLEITGDRGKMVVEHNRIKFWELSASEREYCYNSDKGFEPLKAEEKDVYPDPDAKETGHSGILQNFANAILHGEELLAPGEEGINGLSISNAIHLSDWLGEPVELPVDAEKYLEILRDKIKNSKVKKSSAQSEIADLHGSFNSRWNGK